MSDTVMSIEAIKDWLNREGASITQVSFDTQIHYNQIWRIARGRNTGIKYDNLKKLSDYMRAQDAQAEDCRNAK